MRQKAWIIAIVVAISVSFAAKFALAWNTYGTNDMLTWEADLQKIRHEGAFAIYRDGILIPRNPVPVHMVYNHPPLTIAGVRMLGWLADAAGLRFRFLFRLADALADVFSAAFVFAILTRERIPFDRASFVMFVISPCAVLISGFHGNTDPSMVCFVLLSLFLLGTRTPPWLSGATLGIGMSVKIVPVIFLPAILWYLRGHARTKYFMGVLLTFCLVSLPILWQHPALVLKSVFGYGGLFGYWGLSLLAEAVQGGPLNWFYESYLRGGRMLLAGAIIALTVWLNHPRTKAPLVAQLGAIVFLFICVSPGLGVQYLAWLAPFTALLPWAQAIAFHTATGLYLFVAYNHAAGGLPWYLADTFQNQPDSLVLMAGFLCWIVICVLTPSMLRFNPPRGGQHSKT